MADSTCGVYYKQGDPPFRTAIVAQVESTPPYRVRVNFPDRDNVLSWWLPVLVTKIMNDKFYWQPDVGEQVSVLMDVNDEDGIVLGSVPSQVDAAPSGLTPAQFYVGFQDGTVLQYNKTTHTLNVTLGPGGKLNISVQEDGGITFSLGDAATTDALALVSKLVAAFNTHTHGGGVVPDVPWTPSTIASELFEVSN